MKKIYILVLGTVLVLGFTMGAQAQTETSSATGDASHYEIGQPDSTAQQSAGAVTDHQTAQQPEKQAAPVPDQQATPASNDPAPTGTVTLDDGWDLPAHL
jgi:hypothetical protein